MSVDPSLGARVLLRMATYRDAAMTRDVLQRAGIAASTCSDMPELVTEFGRGASALVVAEDAVAMADLRDLAEALARQEPWSDIPMIVLSRAGARSRTIVDAMENLPNVTVVERPVRVASLVSAMRSMLRARRRQYEVRDLVDNLRQADRRKTEFLATLAHELRNPLAPIRSALDMIGTGRAGPDLAGRLHGIMTRQVDHMVRLVDDLMEVSRITRGKVDLHSVPVEMRSVIADAIELSRPLIEAGGHAFDSVVGADELVVLGDRMRLAQVMANLLNNAARYTPRGGHITLSARREGDDVVIEVVDDGIGLESHSLKTIFEMFAQAGETSKTAQGGLGIGLTLVESLVQMHGGHVCAESDGLGRGAKFTVRLPLLVEAPAATLQMPLAAPAVIERSVLVVDDNRDAADTLTELLCSLGADAFASYSGVEALQVARGRAIDVALLDIGMPGMDGYELARHLRDLPGSRAPTLIALSGWGEEKDRERFLKAGFDHHLLKPVETDRLVALLERCRP